MKTILFLVYIFASEFNRWSEKSVNAAFSNIRFDQLVWACLHTVPASGAKRIDFI
jgi:hypothetical protein